MIEKFIEESKSHLRASRKTRRELLAINNL
jgi:hypothetical protein